MAFFSLSGSPETIDITPLPSFNFYLTFKHIKLKTLCSIAIVALIMGLTLGICLL